MQNIKRILRELNCNDNDSTERKADRAFVCAHNVHLKNWLFPAAFPMPFHDQNASSMSFFSSFSALKSPKSKGWINK